MSSFASVLGAHGTDLPAALTTLGTWSYFSGANAIDRPFGFADAELFPTPPLRSHLAHLEDTITDDIAAMGSHLILVFRDERTGRPTVSFIGERNSSFALTAVVTDPSGGRTVHLLAMVSPSSSGAELPMDWQEVGSIVVVATNLAWARDSHYSFTVNDQGAVGVDGWIENGLVLEPARPNPFRSSTVIAFSLASPGPVRLAIYDVSGRLIRRLHDGTALGAGPHRTEWSGDDQVGRAAAPGVYYYRLESGSHSATERVLLLR
jgi:hypothetical protein